MSRSLLAIRLLSALLSVGWNACMRSLQGRLLSALLLTLCFSLEAEAAELRVFVSIPPQKFLVERIGADTVEARLMLRPGYIPELYEPLPGQLARLQRADLYFRIGVPFERHWREQLRDNERLTVVDCCDGVPAAVADDPHVWTSPPFMIRHAAVIKRHLQQKLPRHRQDYERNYDALLADLRELHREIERLLRPESAAAAKPAIFVVHPSWGHFALEYGLRQYALEKHHGHVGSRAMVELVRLAKQERATVLFSQLQYHPASAQAFAREIGARIVMLDPLAEDYINNMRYVARQFARSLKREQAQ